MRTISHREMRNQSGEILRQVAAGESIRVTNHGEVTALIVPPASDPLTDLVARGQARPPRVPVDALQRIARRESSRPSDEIVADVRGRW
jgi:prevent-host-death family protein